MRQGECLIKGARSGYSSVFPGMQKIETINVRKAGFKDQTGIKVSGTKPLRVTLSP